MIKVFLVTFFLIINIQARENPFFPSEEEDLPITSNKEKQILVLTYRMAKEMGDQFVPLKALANEKVNMF